MTLDNLVTIGRLQRTPVDHDSILRLLTAARRNLTEVGLDGLSSDTRFDLGYKCILQLSMACLAARGFRTSQNQPGHHQTALQCLVWTLGIPSKTLITLESLRKQRNLSDYLGDPVSDSVVRVCVEEATHLIDLAQRTGIEAFVAMNE